MGERNAFDLYHPPKHINIYILISLPQKIMKKKTHDQILNGNLPFIAPNNKCINRIFKGKRGKINIYNYHIYNNIIFI